MKSDLKKKTKPVGDKQVKEVFLWHPGIHLHCWWYIFPKNVDQVLTRANDSSAVFACTIYKEIQMTLRGFLFCFPQILKLER